MGTAYLPEGRLGGAVLALLALAQPAGAAGLRDRSSHPPPPLAVPRAGETYVDPVFGTRILRVTDEDDGGLCTHAYSYWRALNADGTRLLLACDDEAILYRFDAEKLTIRPDGPLRGDDGISVAFEGASWSGRDADAIFALEGTRLWRIDVGRRGASGYELVRDFTPDVPAGAFLAQLSVSDDDRIFTFHGRMPGGTRLDAMAFDATRGELRVFPAEGRAIDESKVDKLGRHVMVDGADGGFWMWDLASGGVDVLPAGDPVTKPGGHADLGRTAMVNGDGWGTGVLVRGYGALHGARNVLTYLRADGALNWSIADHLSLRNDDETFVVGSTYAGDGAWNAFEDEIYLAYLDGSGFVRLAHTRSDQVAPSRGRRYYAQPRAVVDHRGRYVVWTSDLGSPARTDVLLLEIPRELWPTTSAAPTAEGTATARTTAVPGAAGCAVTTGGAGAPAILLAALAGLTRRSRGRTRRGRRGA